MSLAFCSYFLLVFSSCCSFYLSVWRRSSEDHHHSAARCGGSDADGGAEAKQGIQGSAADLAPTDPPGIPEDLRIGSVTNQYSWYDFSSTMAEP